MGWPTRFGLTNAVALLGWLMLAASRRGPRTMAVILFGVVGLLCLAYAVMLGLLVGGVADAGPAGPSGQGAFTIEGIRALFASDGGIVVGWTHYLAFDLFVGLWIAKDADHKRFGRLVQLPFLLATLIAGPVGLLVWLLFRERRARQAARGQ